MNYFGKKGLFIIFICFFYFYLSSAVTSDGLNAILPFYMGSMNVTATQLNIWITIGGWLTFLANFAYGTWSRRSGARPVILTGLIGNVVALIILAFANSVPVFGIGMILYILTTCGVSGIGMGMLGANWFPTKKGQFMGWATMGVTLSGASAAATFGFLLNTFGQSGTMMMFAGLVVIIFFLTLLFVKNTPEEAGTFPDNDPNMTIKDVAALQAKAAEYLKTSQWTKSAILKSGFFWHMIIGWCLLALGSFGLISQLALAYIAFGHEVRWFVFMMAVCAPWGLFTSWFAGYIDSKKGTKFASICCAFMLLVSQVIMVLFGKSLVVMCIGTALLAGTLSGQNNMVMSITASKFGRYDFANGWTMVSIFQKLLSLSGLVFVSFLADLTGGNYQLSIIVSAVFTVVSIFAIATFNEKCVGRITLE